jgi:uncharacterized membrane protein
MAFCAQCGTQLTEGTKFCASCGAAVGAAAAGPVTPAPAGTAMSSNVAGLLCYLFGFITGLIFLVIEPYRKDKFVRFHAFQSIFLSVLWLAFHFVWSSIVMGMFWSPFSGLWGLLTLLSSLISLAFLACVLFLMYKAYNNEEYRLPFLGDLAAKQAGRG